MSTAAFIIGMIILGLCLVAAALILSGSITGAATALKESAPQSLQQPTLTFLTEYDAADYLGISLNELDYIRSEGLLDGAFIAVTSLEQTGEEAYADYEDGVEVTKVRPVMSNVTRFLFNRQLLDEKMMEAIKNGSHINPFRQRAQEKKNKDRKNRPNGEGRKNGKSGKVEEMPRKPVVEIYSGDDEEITSAPEEEKAETMPEREKNRNGKNVQSGPRKPAGPIGEDEGSDEDDDVIDIMANFNRGKKNGGRPSGYNGDRNGGRSGKNDRNGNDDSHDDQD